MSRLRLFVLCVVSLTILSDRSKAARILAFYPTPSISHQVVFRPLSLELAKRGHEVVVVTPDPVFPKGNAPANLTEIDVHDISYDLIRKKLIPIVVYEKGHPKIKFFITQCGLQSTDEAITAGVPLLGMPVMGDQEYNAEQYIFHGIGVVVDIETVTEEKLNKAINTLLRDDSYRKNIVRLRSQMYDQPLTPLERAVWWVEYVIRHSGARHLQAAGAHMSLASYYELELVVYVVLALTSALTLVCSVLYFVYKRLFGVSGKVKKS